MARTWTIGSVSSLCIWEGTKNNANHEIPVFNIISVFLGGTDTIEYLQRFWRLCKKNSTCRVSGMGRMSVGALCMSILQLRNLNDRRNSVIGYNGT
jgi:hypothetical protein